MYNVLIARNTVCIPHLMMCYMVVWVLIILMVISPHSVIDHTTIITELKILTTIFEADSAGKYNFNFRNALIS